VCDIIATGVVYLQFRIILMCNWSFNILVSIHNEKSDFFTR